VSFAVSAQAYDRFMGRYSVPLAPLFADFAGVASGQKALDVGCGPGALTAELVARLGAADVAAVDPSESFVVAVRERYPDVEAGAATAEALPFADDRFDVALAQLVVHFMADPVAGLREMARVTRPGGSVAATVWDHGGSGGPLNLFWNVARELDPTVRDESDLAGVRDGQLVGFCGEAGLVEVEQALLSVSVEHATFEEWWEPYTFGVGPAGAHVAALEPAARDELRERCRAALPAAPFVVTAGAWAARGTVA
jgi:SAM-dependent methyltransferase